MGLAADSLLIFVAGNAAQLFQMLLRIGSARLLSTADRGLFALATTTAGTLCVIFAFGLLDSNVYLYNQRQRALRSLGANVLVTVAVGVVLIGLGDLFLGDWAANSFFDGGREVCRIALLGAPVMLFHLGLRSLDHAQQRFRRFMVLDVLVAATSFCAVMSVLMWTSLGLKGAVLATFAGPLLGGLYLLACRLKELIPPQPSLRLFREQLVYGSKIYLQNALSQLNYRLDYFLVVPLANAETLAHYSISVAYMGLIWLVPSAVGAALFPRIASAGEGRAEAMTAQATRHCVWVSLATACGACIVASPLIQLVFGARYVPAAWPAVLLAPGIVAMAACKVWLRYFNGIDYQRPNIMGGASALVLNVALNLVLIPRYGASGAAVSSSASYLLYTTIVGSAFWRRSGLDAADLFVLKRADVQVYFRVAREAAGRFGLRSERGEGEK